MYSVAPMIRMYAARSTRAPWQQRQHNSNRRESASAGRHVQRRAARVRSARQRTRRLEEGDGEHALRPERRLHEQPPRERASESAGEWRREARESERVEHSARARGMTYPAVAAGRAVEPPALVALGP